MMVWQSISLIRKTDLSLLWAISMHRDIKMRFCNQWHINTVRNQTLISKIIMLAPIDQNLSETTSTIWTWRGWNFLPTVPTSTPLNSCGISSGLLFVPEWLTQPLPHGGRQLGRTLLSDNVPYFKMWPSWWPAWWGGIRLLCMILPYAEAPVC